jgi:hypothetical protein
MNQSQPEKKPHSEPEWTKPIWKHPYMLYVALTGVLFAFLLLMAWLATSNDWIPHR